MKTFLHYTKEKELDEGFFSRLAGVAGKAVDIADKLKTAKETISPLTTALGTPGTKPGAVFGGGLEVAGNLKAASEKRSQEQSALDDEVNKAQEYLANLKLQANTGSPAKRAHYAALVPAAKDNLKRIAKAKTPKELENILKQLARDRAAIARASVP